MTITLTVITVIVILLFFGVLSYLLVRIAHVLEEIGGEIVGYGNRSSYLAKIAFGVRAIEQQTDHLGPEVTKLNAGLSRVSEGLQSIDGHLVATIEAVVRQEEGS